MVPIMTYASTTLYPCPDPRRAGAAPSWVAVGRRLHPAPLPDLVGQRRRPKAPAHRRQPGLLGGHRPQRHHRLPRRGAPLPGGEVLPAQDRPAAARPGPPRRAVPAAAPEPPPGRPAAQHLDAGPGRAGLLRARLDPPAPPLPAPRPEGPAPRAGTPPRPNPPHPLLPPAPHAELSLLLPQSPRLAGQPRSTWTLALVARVCYARGWTPRPLSVEAVRH